MTTIVRYFIFVSVRLWSVLRGHFRTRRQHYTTRRPGNERS